MMKDTSAIDAIRDEFGKETSLHHLVAQFPDVTDQSPVRVAFVGPYNAGKSSLISALTGDLSIGRDSKPETAEVSYYPWNGLQLVDVPGWFSGFSAHDQTADDELRRHADLVVFCITVELGDQNIIDAARRVFGELGFADRSVLVVNKANSEDSAEEVIRGALQIRLGEYADVPTFFTDAQDYLDTIEEALDLEPEAVAFLRADSNVPALGEALEALAAENQDARLRAQAQQIARLVDEAVELLVPTEEERAARAVAAELRTARDACLARLRKAAGSEESRLVKELGALAQEVIDGVRQGETPEASHAAAQRRWGDVSDEALDCLNAILEREVDQLSAETATTLQLLPLEALDWSAPSATDAPEEQNDPGPMRRMFKALEVKPKTVLDPMTEQLQRVVKEGADKDSAAYYLARKLQPNKRFRPYERLNDAKKIHDAAEKAQTISKAAPVLLPALFEGMDWFREVRATRAGKEREAAISRDYARAASEVGADLAQMFEEFLGTAFKPLDDMVSALLEPAEEAEAVRQGTITRLLECRAEIVWTTTTAISAT